MSINAEKPGNGIERMISEAKRAKGIWALQLAKDIWAQQLAEQIKAAQLETQPRYIGMDFGKDEGSHITFVGLDAWLPKQQDMPKQQGPDPLFERVYPVDFDTRVIEKLERIHDPGCRLSREGLNCPIHNPKKPAPYIPAIDDWDLLPDA